ncbi:MAG: HAD family hydrolase [Chloroflexota bacterium]
MKTKLSGIKAIGFDVDGTLYHAPDAMSMEVGKILIRKAALALSQDPDELAEEYLKRRDEYRSNTKTLNSFGLDGEKIFQEVWDQIEIEKYVAEDSRLVKLIQKLKTNYRLFIITNGTGTQVERKLTKLGLDYHDFDPRIYCYDQGWIKPEPAPYLAAIESLGLKPDEIVYVGDREDVDIEGAQAVGMKAIFVGGVSKKAEVSCETVYDIGLLL